jgi:DNA-binding IclR family transcriptional regulator
MTTVAIACRQANLPRCLRGSGCWSSFIRRKWEQRCGQTAGTRFRSTRSLRVWRRFGFSPGFATEAIAELVLRIDQTVALSVWGNHGATVVRIDEGTGAVHVNMRVGSIMSLLGTATGRVFAAFLPPKMIETFIESGVDRASVGDEAVRQMTRNQIDKAVAEVREKGLARAVEKPIPGVNAFSAPVFDHSGSIALVITAIGPSHTFDADWNGPIAEELRKCAASVSMRLGFSSKGSKAA